MTTDDDRNKTDTAVYGKLRCRTKFGEHGFSHAGPTAWKSSTPSPSNQWHWSFHGLDWVVFYDPANTV